MSTWIRTNSVPYSSVGSDLTPTISLTNGTAPGDFDPANVNSVAVDLPITGSGFGDDRWRHNKSWRLGVTSSTGEAAIYDSAGAANLANEVYDPGTMTDNFPSSTLTVANWESLSLYPHPTDIDGTAYASYLRNMGGDGGILAIPLSSTVVTIDYIPVTTYLGRYRFWDNPTPGSGSPLAAEDTSIDLTQGSGWVSILMRIRAAQDGSIGRAMGGSIRFRRNGGAASAIGPSTSYVKYVDGGTAGLFDLTTYGVLTDIGYLNMSNLMHWDVDNYTSSYTLDGLYESEFWYSIAIDTTSLSAGDTITFHYLDSVFSMDALSKVPTINIVSGGGGPSHDSLMALRGVGT